MSAKERHVAPGTEGTPHLFAAFPRLFPEESFGLLTALRSPEPSFADLRAIYTSEQAAEVRKSLQATYPRKIGIQPPSSYQALFDAAAVEHTREQQIRAALIYGNYHIAEKQAKSFYHSMQSMGVSLPECLDEALIALTAGIPKALTHFHGNSAAGFATWIEQVVTYHLSGWYKHERLRTQIPVKKAQRGKELLQSTQVLQEINPGLFTSGVLFTTQRQETNPEHAAEIHETLHQIGAAIQSRYNTPKTRYYGDIFTAALQGVSVEELTARYGKSAVAIQSVLRRAKRTVEHLRPPELQEAKRAQTFRKRHSAP